MNFSDLITPELVLVPFESEDKWTAISAMARASVTAGQLPERKFEEVDRALLERERSLTTGMEHGIAIPHAAVDGIDDLITVLGLSSKGIPFEAVDGLPARIVVCLIIPRAKKLLHIKTLAAIARLLGREAVRDDLLRCTAPASVVDVLRAAEADSQAGSA